MQSKTKYLYNYIKNHPEMDRNELARALGVSKDAVSYVCRTYNLKTIRLSSRPFPEQQYSEIYHILYRGPRNKREQDLASNWIKTMCKQFREKKPRKPTNKLFL